MALAILTADASKSMFAADVVRWTSLPVRRR